jgi:hypothetical protein
MPVFGVFVLVLVGSGAALRPAEPSPIQGQAGSTSPQSAIPGVVQDETGGVLPNAHADLVTSAGAVVASVVTDTQGRFHFDAVPVGRYQVRVTFERFTPATVSASVGARPVATLKVVLHLAEFKEGVTVSTEVEQVSTAPTDNVSAIKVDRKMLDSLPIFDQDYIGALSNFLDPGSLGSGGATLVVNGMEVSALRVSASAIQQIKINQDPYAAEYGRPGRGRIDILTSPGGQQYHGEFNTVVRDARLDARNAFAATKPAEQKRIFEGMLGGPLGTTGKTSFVLSANDQTDDQQAIVFATGLTGPIQDLVPQPSTQGLVSLAITHQISPSALISITPSYEYEANDNRGVGGTTLASAGSIFRHREEQVRFTYQTSWHKNWLNQFQVLVGHEREPTTSVSPDRGIVVAGAFTGGGAQGDLTRTETHTQLNESLTWSAGHHTVQAGLQLPDWSRRGFYDRTNFGGTYFFSSLQAYAAGQPYAFTEQQGNGTLALLEKQIGLYVKDDWQVRSNLSLSLGLRYDWQNYFHDDDNFGPRVSFAYAPHGSKANVVRGGVGLFSDRSGPVILAELLHSERGDLTRFVVTNPSFPDPGPALAAEPPSITQLAPGVQIPRTLQFSLNLDHQIRKGLTASIGYTGAHGYHLFRSRDVNAPPPPLFIERPNPAYGAIRQIESTGHQTTQAVSVTIRGQVTRWFNGQTQYTLSRAFNDTSGLNSYPANDYDLTGEWGRADFDRRHKFVLLGRTTVPRLPDLGVSLTMNSAGPYTELLGSDLYSNGRGGARPLGVGRNTLTAAGFAQLDLRLSHEVALSQAKDGRAIVLALDAFNVLNRINYGTFVGTVGSPFFGQPISARPPRQLQLSLRVNF